MVLSTKNLNKNNNNSRDKIIKLKEKHLPLFVKEGVVNPKFIPRMAYKHNGELIIGFYEREIRGGVDIYTEFVSRDYVPEDQHRRIWKWLFNPEYKTEYEISDPHAATGDIRYFIPVDELIDVSLFHEELDKSKVSEETEKEGNELLPYDMPSSDEDIPYSAITLRDHCAIQWQKPVSKKKWLNSLITNTFK
jgi:hypothetical protein